MVDHKDSIGKQFGRLKVNSFFKKGRYLYYNCTCLCGKESNPTTFSVLKGMTTSCGCYYVESRYHKKSKPRSDIIPNGGSAGNYIFLTYRRNAKIRNYEFCLTKEQFAHIVVKNCYYCGSGVSQVYRYSTPKKSEAFHYNGVDRMDNTKGYTLENSVPCCGICNKAKGSLPLEDFQKWVNRLAKYVSCKL